MVRPLQTLGSNVGRTAAKHADDDWNVVKVDCTVEKATCKKHGVKGYPTLKAFVDGEVKPYFAPWCGHCKNMAPAWEALAKANQNGKVRIAEIDCTTDAEACSDAGVRGYPTLIAFNTNTAEGTKYQGARTQEAFQEFVNGLTSGDKTEL